jgi:flagellar protein FlaG
MTSIDTSISTQMGDVQRPAQTFQDANLQTQAATTQQQAAASDPAPAQTKPISSTDANALAAQLQQVVESFSYKQLSLNVDSTNKELYMQVTDSATGEVIQQIPSKNMRDLEARLQQSTGALLDEQA